MSTGTAPSEGEGGHLSLLPRHSRRPRRRLAPGADNGIYANCEDSGDRRSAPAPRRPRSPPPQGRAAGPEVATELLSPWVTGRPEKHGAAGRGGGGRRAAPGCGPSNHTPVFVFILSLRPGFSLSVPCPLISISRGPTPYLHSRILVCQLNRDVSTFAFQAVFLSTEVGSSGV